MAGKRSNTTKARASSEETPASSKKLKKTLEGEAVDKKEEEKEIQQSSIGVIDDELEARFLGDVVPAEEARQRWPKRYEVRFFVIDLCTLSFASILEFLNYLFS